MEAVPQRQTFDRPPYPFPLRLIRFMFHPTARALGYPSPMPFSKIMSVRGGWLAAAVLLAAPAVTMARDTTPANPWALPENSEAYRAECGACHYAFPPGLLIVDDWLALMSDLEHHFGANAGTEPKQAQAIRAFLEKNGATDRKKYASQEEDLPRITTLPWFMQKHAGSASVVAKGRVKSLLDCAACHKGP